jgi:SAM-dependent methyltransferase
MNHYFKVKDSMNSWWKSGAWSESPFISELIEKHWDHGPFEVVSRWIERDSSVVELGCGVGGLYRKLQAKGISYLGVDSSFLSILIARHIYLGGFYPGKLRYPADLLFGNLAQTAEIPIAKLGENIQVDFVVGEIDAVPVERNFFDSCISMNAIDMLDEPGSLPEVQRELVHSGGEVIQTGPYIWHEKVARGLRGRAPKACDSSASVVEWLYEKVGLKIEARELHVPWLFFKHLRQLEVYSVHAFRSRRS